MKKLFVIFFLLVSTLSFGQRVIISLAGGPSLTQSKRIPKAYPYGYIRDMSFFTYTAGIKASISIHKKWEIRTGLFLTEKGYSNRLPLYFFYDSLAFPTLGNHGANTVTARRLPIFLAFKPMSYLSFFVGSGIDLSVIRYEMNREYKLDFPVQNGITYTYRNLSIDMAYVFSTRPYGKVRQSASTNKLSSFYNRQTSLVLSFAINKKGKYCEPCNRKRL